MNTGLLQIKGRKPLLKSRLEASAKRNNRSLNQEALERLERSFEIEDALVSARDQRWMDEALAGEFRPGSLERIRLICAKARECVMA